MYKWYTNTQSHMEHGKAMLCETLIPGNKGTELQYKMGSFKQLSNSRRTGLSENQQNQRTCLEIYKERELS